jgi:hypothetical protein
VAQQRHTAERSPQSKLGRSTRHPPSLLTSTPRTAGCGPACPVVWQGRAGDCSPYADVRPSWAHSYGCKSRHKLVTASEAKRNCMRATECGEEAWSESAGR